MKKNLVLKQKQIISFVKNHFVKGNSPFLKINYFALYEDGVGMRKIKKEIFNLKKKEKRYFLSKVINLIENFK